MSITKYERVMHALACSEWTQLRRTGKVFGECKDLDFTPEEKTGKPIHVVKENTDYGQVLCICRRVQRCHYPVNYPIYPPRSRTRRISH